MSTAAADAFDHQRRSAAGCLCCGAQALDGETALVSAFVAKQAMRSAPELTRILFCRQCGFRFFDRGLSEIEAARYYDDYRSDTYLSTACRILLGFLPPFGFIPMREHLQYFTEPALVAMARRSGLRVVRSGRNAAGQIYLTATH